MSSEPERRHIETYVLPILLYLVVIGCSFLIGSLQRAAFFTSLALVAVVITGAFVAQVLAKRRLDLRDRAHLFNTLSELSFARHDSRRDSGILSEPEVLAIEACAREVWIYAYDLQWESNESPLTRLVTKNLERGVPYRYLVPRSEQVELRVKVLTRCHEHVRNVSKMMSVRTSERASTITQFGCTIYNPDLEREAPGASSATEPVAVFFPHYANYHAEGARGEALFLSVRGVATRDIQAAFLVAWGSATPHPSKRSH